VTVLRAWPWTIALASVLAGFVLVGLVGIAVHSSTVSLLISVAVTLLAALALSRSLSAGVRITPSGLIIRELTRTTPVPWEKVRSVACEKSQGRGYVPVLRLSTSERLEVTVLAAYRVDVAQRRADVLSRAFAGSRKRRR
jgi:PH (Pleckstrin Homology) domain-containing protein